MISKQLRREVGRTHGVAAIKKEPPKNKIKKKQFWKKFRKGAGKIARNLPIEITRDISELSGKPIPKKLKHTKLKKGYESAFGRSLFK